MKKILFPLAAATFVLGCGPSAAQSAQDQLDARYDRALAAGYKALFLCSAIANAERNGTTRTPESIHEWELTGIQAPLDDIVRELSYDVLRYSSDRLQGVSVSWADDSEPRIAMARRREGCSILPIATSLDAAETIFPEPIPRLRTGAVGQSVPVRIEFDEVGIPHLALAPITQEAFGDTYGQRTRSTAVFILKDRAVVAERYAEDFGPNVPQRTWSVAKSIAATFVGYSSQLGHVRTEDSAGLGVDDSDPRRAITVDHALRMASGRYSDTPGNRTDPIYWGGATVDERAQNWPLTVQPGSKFRYANNDTLAAVMAVDFSNRLRLANSMLFAIGMRHSFIESDWQGNPVLSSQVWSTARDLARLGQLHLDDGVMPDGVRILPEGWVDYISSPSGPQPEGRPFGYGASWWLLNNSEGVPPDTFGAFGNRGQYVIVVPSREVVIVRRGEDMVGTRFDIAAFTRDVLAALEE